jgi:hypothetical protein
MTLKVSSRPVGIGEKASIPIRRQNHAFVIRKVWKDTISMLKIFFDEALKTEIEP